MRFRDLASITFAAALTVWLGFYGRATVENTFYDSHAINREDARSVLATLLSHDQWVEFQILHDATPVRLLTNAALQSTDAPDHDLTNPRLGWRYTIAYELLDAERNVVDKSEYHFRTQIRQLLDQHTGQPIYPIFLGKSGLVSAQTRPMQLAITHFPQRPVILRVRLKSADAGIRQVVGRSLSRIQREDFDKRYTWNRLSEQRRDLICKYTVYEPDLLTAAERTNLLKWRWAQTPTVTQSPQRHLFFIGSFDDQEVRDEQLPQGLFADRNWLATVPVPEGQGQVRMEFTAIDPVVSAAAEVDVQWFGVDSTDRLLLKHPLVKESTELTLSVDGGLIQLNSPARIVTRVYWRPVGATHHQADNEIEITPAPVLIKAFVADDQALEYSISHLDHAPTPVRLSLRYPFGPHFKNLTITSTDDPAAGALGSVDATWEYLDGQDNTLASGVLSFDPVVSRYDHLDLISGPEWLSEPREFFFSVPANVARLRIRSQSCRLLVNAAVRPYGMGRVTQVPEEYHAFSRMQSPNRTWFAINPTDEHDLIQANRSIILRSCPRPPDINQEVVAGNYRWQRFQPSGQWIGRQMLVPKDSDFDVRDEAIGSVYYELKPHKNYDFKRFDSPLDPPAKLIVIGDDAPGTVRIQLNNRQVYAQAILSARSEIDLSDVAVPSAGQISVASDSPARFFFAGRDLQNGNRFLKRTAQRLGKRPLVFRYEKQTHDDELLTIQVYRGRGDQDRCKLRVRIDPDQVGVDSGTNPLDSWTVRDRTYDLRPHTDQGSLLIGVDTPADVGHRCFVRLGKDLAPGSYQIQVQRADDGPDGFVLMYQTLPGQFADRKIRVNSAQQGNEDDG